MVPVSVLVSFFYLLPLCFCEPVTLFKKPNIIMIVADDLGYNDVGFHGSDVRTPNIDALAGHGIIVQRHYSLPACSPSRAALMTGKYPIRTGMQGLPIQAGFIDGLPLNEKIFPEFFRKLGYKTHLLGKWHLGFETWRHVPTNRGFDTFYGYLNGFLGYYDGVHSHRGYSGIDFRRNEASIWPEVYKHYLTELLTKEAVTLIENHDSKEGFFMILNHAAPHKGNLDFIQEAPPGNKNFTGRAILAGMVQWLDDSVGQVVSSLKKKGILDNSIIVFISDNGAPTIDLINNYYNCGSNWPLRGLKLSSHEGGIRTVALAWSPIFRHRISTDLFHITDWLPTLYTAAGGKTEDLKDLDGLSHWHALVNNTPGPRADALLNLETLWNNEALIKGKWKIIKNHSPTSNARFSDDYYGVSGRDTPYNSEDVKNSIIGKILGEPLVSYEEIRFQAALNDTCVDKKSAESTDCHNKYCLYDIVADYTECQDLSSQYPEVVIELESLMKVYWDQMVPSPKTGFNERAHPNFWGGYWSPWMDNGVATTETGISFMFLLIIHLLQFFQ